MAGTYTRRDWAVALLAALGNSAPTEGTIDYVVNWSTQENNQTQPGYNLLNTTYPLNGSTSVNSVGVQQYQSFADGITANADTLRGSQYPVLLGALINNDSNALDSGNSAIQSEMGTWGTGWKSWFGQPPSAAALAQQEPGDQLNLAQPGSAAGAIVSTIQNTQQLLANLASAWQTLSSPGTWIRVGLFTVAITMLIIGVVVLDTAPKTS